MRGGKISSRKLKIKTEFSVWSRSDRNTAAAIAAQELQQVPQPVVQHRQHQRWPPKPSAAGKIAVRNAGKDVEPLGHAGDGFGGKFPAQPRQPTAGAGKSLQKKDI